MNSPFCFYSFIFTKFDRVRQILYNIERKNMERGMSMMKSSVKKIDSECCIEPEALDTIAAKYGAIVY